MKPILEFFAMLTALPIILGISWLVGIMFRSYVLKQNMAKGNKYLQIIISIIIGIIILVVLGIISDGMGCTSAEDAVLKRY